MQYILLIYRFISIFFFAGNGKSDGSFHPKDLNGNRNQGDQQFDFFFVMFLIVRSSLYI
jgi:hypothetical protein